MLELKYFHYRVYDDALGVSSSEAHPDDPSVGRVLVTRIAPPRTVGVFKRAVAQLEALNLSRFDSFKFTEDGEEIADDHVLELPPDVEKTEGDDEDEPKEEAESTVPGASLKNPFVLFLSPLIDDVADVVMSKTEPGKAAYRNRPTGWRTCKAEEGSRVFYKEDSQGLLQSTVTIGPSVRIFVHPLSYSERPGAGVGVVTQKVMLPHSREVGYMYYGKFFSSTYIPPLPLANVP